MMQRKRKPVQVAVIAATTMDKLDNLIRATMPYALENNPVPDQKNGLPDSG
ncbi:hypothetical protein [Georgfuchsia toluolica]|uniref:hypothetical protein n=1 Tax=Georgfuchsia toluolica TaxID=424218 RepID=UPI001C72B77D|nr:hypothetical protein [Georgfuchsia toluolica]